MNEEDFVAGVMRRIRTSTLVERADYSEALLKGIKDDELIGFLYEQVTSDKPELCFEGQDRRIQFRKNYEGNRE